ncbi:MAG: hypothetical protein UIC64_04170 [Agathobacter sp.]|nr:hypothetical protein [Agathobacter sp.]
MRFKYYLRGLGLGIIATVLILAISGNVRKEKLTDQEIINRAEALGMVMVDDSETEEDLEIKENSEIQENDSENQSETESESEQLESYTINIEIGTVCREIAEELYEAGMVADAEEFRNYMGEKGYADDIVAGEHVIPFGATYDEIGEIVTHQQ